MPNETGQADALTKEDVSPAMIAAGLGALDGAIGVISDQAVVQEVYRAMVRASGRPQATGASHPAEVAD